MTQVDTSIYGNMLRPVKSVQEYDAEAQQAESNKLGLLLQRGQYDAQQRGVADDAAYRDAVKGFGADSGANANMLRARGLGKQAMDYEKSALEAGKTSAEVANLKKTGAKTDSDLMDASLKRYRTGLDFIESPQGAVKWLQSHYQVPALSALMNSRGPFEEAIKHIPQTPAEFNQWRDKVAMGIENYSKKLQEDRKIAETASNNKAQRGIAARNASTAEGQLSVARQRLTIDQQAPKGHYDSERGTVTDLRTGVAQPVTMGGKPLGPKDKAGTVTEGERNAGGYLLRMTEATKLLDKFEKTGTASYGSELAGAVPFVGGMTRRAVMSDDQQQYRQAQEDWVRAKLRKESGASIPPDEMDREIEAYFPMPGEGERVRAQKRQSRAVANTAMQQSAGRAAAQQNGGASGELGGGWSIQEVK